jgi:gamma-glutamyl-gamma-aminobutyrate hydrolase PuuD
VIEAVELKDAAQAPFLLGVQFHPERLIDRNGIFRQIFTGFVAACARWREKDL